MNIYNVNCNWIVENENLRHKHADKII